MSTKAIVDNNIIRFIDEIEDIEINTSLFSEESLNKVKKLDMNQLRLLKKIIRDNKQNGGFEESIKDFISYKNIVNGDIHANSVHIGDTIHYEYHNHDYTKTIPKNITIDIPKLTTHDIIGRTNEINDINNLLLNNSKVLLVNGLGGIGKTTIAKVYIDKYKERYKHIVWINHYSDDIISDFINTEGLIPNLNINIENKAPKDIFIEVMIELNRINDNPNLLVIDNGNISINNISKYLPHHPNWHILVTSREKIDNFNIIDLGFLTENESLELFKSHYTLNILADSEIKELVGIIDYHTLTIELLAKVAQKQRFDFSKLRNALKDNLNANISINHSDKKVQKIMSYLTSVFSLTKLNSDEIGILKQISCLPSEYYNYSILEIIINTDVVNSIDELHGVLHELTDYGWLLSDNKDNFKMHKIISEVIRQDLKSVDVRSTLGNINNLLDVSDDFIDPLNRFKYIPLGNEVLNLFSEPSEILFDLHNNLGLINSDLTKYTESMNHFNKALEIYESDVSININKYSNLLSNKSLTLHILGFTDEALELLYKSLEIDKKSYGLLHPANAVRYLNLASIFLDIDETIKARKYLNECDRINRQVLVKEHQYNINTQLKYSEIYLKAGDFTKAINIQLEVIRYYEKHYGENHSVTNRSYLNLVEIYVENLQYLEAKPIINKACTFYENNYGIYNFRTIIAYLRKSLIESRLGNIEEAECYLDKTMKFYELNKTSDNPRILDTLNNLIKTLHSLGSFKKAIEVSNIVISQYNKRYSSPNSKVIESLGTYCSLLLEIKDYTTAKKHINSLIVMSEKLYGQLNIVTIINYNIKGAILNKTNEKLKSKNMFLKALTSIDKLFPNGNQYTIVILSNLALLLKDMERYTKSLEYLYRASLISERIVGVDNREYALIQNNLAAVYMDQLNLSKAKLYSDKAVSISLKVYPQNHPALIAIQETNQLIHSAKN